MPLGSSVNTDRTLGSAGVDLTQMSYVFECARAHACGCMHTCVPYWFRTMMRKTDSILSLKSVK